MSDIFLWLANDGLDLVLGVLGAALILVILIGAALAWWEAVLRDWARLLLAVCLFPLALALRLTRRFKTKDQSEGVNQCP